jgi:hypothetical protein
MAPVQLLSSYQNMLLPHYDLLQQPKHIYFDWL